MEPEFSEGVRTYGLGDGCARRGSLASFDLEFRPLRAELLIRARRFAGDLDAAEDLVQETAIRLFKSWDRIEMDRVEQYATRVLLRVYLDSLRAARRRVQTICVSQLDDMDLWLEQVAREIDAPLPAEFHDSVARAAAKLSPVMRDVVRLFSSGAQYEEMAVELGVPVGTIRSRLNRAREVMRAYLN